MDFLRQIENIQNQPSARDLQDLEKITSKQDDKCYMKHNTCKKTTGEYFATIEDKIAVGIINNKYIVSFK